MKKAIVIAAAGLLLLSAAAYAQMQHGSSDRSPMQQHEHGSMGPNMMGMHGPMMHGSGMHGGMMHGHMSSDHSTSGAAGSHRMQGKGDSSPSSLAFQGINAKMHGAMDIAFTGNADVDFLRGMIPHHEGAVDMAKTVMAFGKDAEVRKLAEEIVRAQEREIALMQDLLKKNGQ